MEKAAVLHWLQGVHASSSFGATDVEECNEWYFNPDSIIHNTSAPNLSQHTTNPPNKQQLENLCTQLPYRGSAKKKPLSSLVPSSTFQVPQDPSELQPTETVKKLMRRSSLSSIYTGHKQKEVINKTEQDAKTYLLPHTQPTDQGSGFPKSVHRNSNSPLPVANPDIVLPTIDLMREPTRRKPLSRKMASEISNSFKSTTYRTRAVTLPVSTTHRDIPKSAPVSPDIKYTNILERPTVIPPSGRVSLSQCDLSMLSSIETPAFQSSPSPDPTSSNGGNTDSGSHMAEKGGLSDPASSDDYRLLSDFDSASTPPKLQCVLEVTDTQELHTSGDDVDARCECLLEATSDSLLELGERSCGGFDSSEVCHSQIPVASLTSLADESSNNGLVHRVEVKEELEEKGSADREELEEEGVEKRDASMSREEELLEILKKWYSLGHGEKQDLIRALTITGKISSADKLLIEGDAGDYLKDADCQETCGPNVPERSCGQGNGHHSPPPPSKEVACTIRPSPPPADKSVLCQPPYSQARPTNSTSLSPTSHHPPILALPHGRSFQPQPAPLHLPLPPRSHAPHFPSHHPPQMLVSPATISKRKLAEMDKANAFNFDDSSDDFQRTNPSKFLSKRNTVSTRCHNRSLSDYSGSLTSSSSQGSHVISSSRHMTLPGTLPVARSNKSKGVLRLTADDRTNDTEYVSAMKHFDVSPTPHHTRQHGFTDLERKGQIIPAIKTCKATGTARLGNKLYCHSDMNQPAAVPASPSTHQKSATPGKISFLGSTRSWISSGELHVPKRE